MRIRIGEVRRLKTNDVVMVTEVRSTYVTVVPVAFGPQENMVGRYFDFRGMNVFLDFPARVNHELMGEYLTKVPETTAIKIGRDIPAKFKGVADRMQMLNYINSADDIERVNKAEGHKN